MTETAEKLRSELQALPIIERAELAHFLIQSLDEVTDKTGDASELDQKLTRRSGEIHAGLEQGEIAEEVFAALRAKYASPNAG